MKKVSKRKAKSTIGVMSILVDIFLARFFPPFPPPSAFGCISAIYLSLFIVRRFHFHIGDQVKTVYLFFLQNLNYPLHSWYIRAGIAFNSNYYVRIRKARIQDPVA